MREYLEEKSATVTNPLFIVAGFLDGFTISYLK